jgi:LacI family transcriptional regulator
MSITLKDIAKRVGKSVPTVSRALAGYADISPATRKEVQQVAREMGYEPNTAARNLQKQRTNTIALILPTIEDLRFSDPFFSELLSGIVEQTAQCGYDLLISTSASGEDVNKTYLSHIRSRRVDGFVVVRTQRQDSRIDILRHHNIPFVAFGRTEKDNDFHLIDEDGAYGIRQVVDHLVALGHTRLACIAEPTNFTKSFHRVQGFIQGLQAHNLPIHPDLIVETRFRQRSGRLGAHQLFDRFHLPTAIVACNDLLALGAMSAAQERGLVVGRDVSITGFDDIALAEYAHPPLTTVHQPAHELGTMIAQMLMNIINRKPIAEKQIIVQPALVVRQSSGPAPQ